MKHRRAIMQLEQRLEPRGQGEREQFVVSADEAEAILQILFEAGGPELVESVIGCIDDSEVNGENIDGSEQ